MAAEAFGGKPTMFSTPSPSARHERRIRQAGRVACFAGYTRLMALSSSPILNVKRSTNAQNVYHAQHQPTRIDVADRFRSRGGRAI